MANGYLMMSQLLSQSLHQTTQCAWSANQSSFPCTYSVLFYANLVFQTMAVFRMHKQYTYYVCQ